MFKSPGMHCTVGKSEGNHDIMTLLSFYIFINLLLIYILFYLSHTDLGLTHPISITDGRLDNESL